MTARTRVRRLLDEGRPAGGLFLSIAAPFLVEIAAVAGYDFVLIDLEHTLIGGHELEALLAAADRAGVSALVRVPDARSERILQALDAGAAGIVVPRVTKVEEAEEAVRRSHYAPLGQRGLNAGRLGRFGDCDLVALLERLNEETLLVAMIEDREGLAAAGEIAAVPGIGALLLGAADYSAAIGKPWQTTCEEVIAAGRRLADAARESGRHLFVIPRREEDIACHLAEGALGLIVANDRGLIRHALTQKNQVWRAIAANGPVESKE